MAYETRYEGLDVRPAKKKTRKIGVRGKDTLCLTTREKATLSRECKRLEKRIRMKCKIKKGV